VNDEPMQLGCGRDLVALAAQVFDGVSPVDGEHQRSCSHCQAALRRIRAVAHDVQGLAAEPVDVPPGLLRAVMARLRAAPALVTLDVRARGVTMVADDVIAQVAVRAALTVDGVGYASVLGSEPSTGATVGLRVRLVVAYGPSVHAIADGVRAAITADVAALTGAALGSVDVTIDDLA